MDTTRQTFTKESGGWTVYTYVNGKLRCQTWTAGTKRDANDVARQDRLALTTGRDLVRACPSPDSATECALMRERLVAGVCMAIPDCPIHGACDQ